MSAPRDETLFLPSPRDEPAAPAAAPADAAAAPAAARRSAGVG